MAMLNNQMVVYLSRIKLNVTKTQAFRETLGRKNRQTPWNFPWFWQNNTWDSIKTYGGDQQAASLATLLLGGISMVLLEFILVFSKRCFSHDPHDGGIFGMRSPTKVLLIILFIRRASLGCNDGPPYRWGQQAWFWRPTVWVFSVNGGWMIAEIVCLVYEGRQ